MAENERCVRCTYDLTWFGLWDSLLLCVFKAVVGYATHSKALTIGAVYSLHDVVSGLAILLGLKVADQIPDKEHPYGRGGMENVASFLTGVIILLSTLFLLVESVLILATGHYPKPHWMALFAAIAAGLINETIYRYNICAYRNINSPAILAHARHHRADAASSAAAALAILGAKVMGWQFLDPAVAVLEAMHLLALSYEILVESGSGLMDRGPKEEELSAIRKVAMRVAGEGALRGVRARYIGRSMWVDLRLSLPGATVVSEAVALGERVRAAMGRGVRHVANVSVVYE